MTSEIEELLKPLRLAVAQQVFLKDLIKTIIEFNKYSFVLSRVKLYER